MLFSSSTSIGAAPSPIAQTRGTLVNFKLNCDQLNFLKKGFPFGTGWYLIFTGTGPVRRDSVPATLATVSLRTTWIGGPGRY